MFTLCDTTINFFKITDDDILGEERNMTNEKKDRLLSYGKKMRELN